MKLAHATISLCLAAACQKTQAAPTTAPPSQPAPCPEQVSSTREPLRDLDARVQKVMEALRVPGIAVAVVKDGEVVLAKGYGVRERGKDAAVDADTVFAIASNTKAFIGTALALLAHEKKLDLDDRVKDRLPWFKTWDPQTTKEMRVRDLVSHRSGLDTWAGDLVWIGSKVDTRTLLSRLPSLPAKSGLRGAYGYSNIMFVVAGEVIAAVTGKPWDAVVTQRLLAPIGMNRTSTSLAALAQQDNVATPHAKHGDADVVDRYLSVDNAGAAGALNSSVADMSRWLLVQLGDGSIDGKQIVPPEVVRATRVPHTPVPLRPDDPLGRHLQAYGLGWFLYDYRGRGVVTHGGGLPGMTSQVLMVPEEKLGVVVLTNSESGASGIIALEVVDDYLADEPTDHLARVLARQKGKAEPEVAAPEGEPLPAKAIQGTYKNALLGRAIVGDVQGVLELRLPDHGGLDCPLRPKAGPVYGCKWSNPIFGESDVEFDVARGRAVGLKFKVRPQFIDPLEYAFRRQR
jgi:CubicO group peptidase (beta-lactamase class C family)